MEEDVGDGTPVGVAHGQEDSRHEGEVKGHVELVAVPEVRPDVGRPLIGLGEKDPSLVARLDLGPHLAQELVSLRQVLAVGAVALEEVRHGVAPVTVETAIEPELHGVEHLSAHGGIVVVEVGLVLEEAVPVVGLGDRIPGPVRGLGVDEDDPRLAEALIRVAPQVVVAVRRLGRPPRRLEPGMLIRGVVHHEVRDDAEAVGMGGLEEALEVGRRPVVGMDRAIVRHVVAVVAERRRKEGEEPETVHAQLLEIVEPARQPREIADPVAVAVLKGADVQLVEDGVLVPEGIAHPPPPGRRAR